LIKLGLNIPNYGSTGTPREMRGWMRVARDGGFGEGSLAQITADVRALGELGAEYVVLDTNPDRPEGRLASETDWRAVTAVAASVLSSD
jgi:hypothetical protein